MTAYPDGTVTVGVSKTGEIYLIGPDGRSYTAELDRYHGDKTFPPHRFYPKVAIETVVKRKRWKPWRKVTTTKLKHSYEWNPKFTPKDRDEAIMYAERMQCDVVSQLGVKADPVDDFLEAVKETERIGVL